MNYFTYLTNVINIDNKNEMMMLLYAHDLVLISDSNAVHIYILKTYFRFYI